jgi:hypothetical protein
MEVPRTPLIFCRSCDIALPDGTARCPMCQRNLRLPVKLIAGGVVLLCVLMGVLLWGSGRLKNRVDRWQVSSEDARQAAQKLVATNPAVHNPVGFSGMDQTTVEHWDGRRWRVSGYFDTRPQPGVKVRTLYFAVLLHDGKIWNLEDLQLQSMEFGSGSSVRKN